MGGILAAFARARLRDCRKTWLDLWYGMEAGLTAIGRNPWMLWALACVAVAAWATAVSH